VSENDDKYTKGMVDWSVSDNATVKNYCLWQYQLISEYIGKDILEIGAGSGRLSEIIVARNQYDSYVSIEPSDKFFSELSNDTAIKGRVSVFKMTSKELDKKYYNSFDTMLLIHVLEHIEDDLTTLEGLKPFLKKSGKLIIMVPSYNFLFSDLDRRIGHYRRYNKKMLKDMANLLDLNIYKMQYTNVLGIFGWFWFCKVRKCNFNDTSKKNEIVKGFRFFDKYLLPFVTKIENNFNLPLGLNLTCVLTKKDDLP